MKNHTDFMIQQSFRALDRMARDQERVCLRHRVELVKSRIVLSSVMLFVSLTIALVFVGWLSGGMA